MLTIALAGMIAATAMWLREARRREAAERTVDWLHALMRRQHRGLAAAVEEAGRVPERLRLYMESPQGQRVSGGENVALGGSPERA